MTEWWRSDLGEIAYRTSRLALTGDEQLLLLHAVGGSSHIWDGVLPALSDRMPGTAVVTDLLGHGYSADPHRDITLSEHADSLGALMAGLGAPQYAVAGTSMGALIALELAARYPNRVSSLTLIGCPGWHLESQRMARLRTMASKVGPDGLPQPNSPLGGTITTSVERDRRRQTDLQRCGRWFISSWWAIASFDPIPRLSRIRCPIHVVMGESDFHLATSYSLVDGARDSRMTVLPAAGHLVPFDDPVGVADAIAATNTI